MNRSAIIWLVVIIVVILIALYSLGSFGTGTQTPGEQPSPHAIDQSP